MSSRKPTQGRDPGGWPAHRSASGTTDGAADWRTDAPVTADDDVEHPLWCFVQGFFKHPRQVAACLPSSPQVLWQLRRMRCLREARSVVELGPGTGATTRALLEALPAAARLLCVELVPEFAACVQRIADRRLEVLEGSAEDLTQHLARLDFPPPDVVVSGIPFSTLPPDVGERVIRQIHDVLTPGGTFIAYQCRDRVCSLAEAHFGAPETSPVLWNLPPVRVYEWRKADETTASEGP